MCPSPARERALQLEAVPEPAKPKAGPGRGHKVQQTEAVASDEKTVPHGEGSFMSHAAAERLRAIASRAPEEARQFGTRVAPHERRQAACGGDAAFGRGVVEAVRQVDRGEVWGPPRHRRQLQKTTVGFRQFPRAHRPRRQDAKASRAQTEDGMKSRGWKLSAGAGRNGVAILRCGWHYSECRWLNEDERRP